MEENYIFNWFPGRSTRKYSVDHLLLPSGVAPCHRNEVVAVQVQCSSPARGHAPARTSIGGLHQDGPRRGNGPLHRRAESRPGGLHDRRHLRDDVHGEQQAGQHLGRGSSLSRSRSTTRAASTTRRRARRTRSSSSRTPSTHTSSARSSGSRPTAASNVTRLETLVTDAGDWLFNAAHALHFALLENRAPVPAGQRDSPRGAAGRGRRLLRRLPDGQRQRRTVGHAVHARRGRPEHGRQRHVRQRRAERRRPRRPPLHHRRGDGCRRGLVDLLGGGDGGGRLPDSHEFRIEGGKIHGVHTITVCADQPMCGFDLSPDMKTELGKPDYGY